ncbi:MAG: 50S ribosomal protein L9 [Bacteroidales bacterium]|nr:50S ribosomal protein L9 [Bacteroidales bacterium]
MEIILKKDVANLGFAHDVITVKHGYARNFLIPQGLAILATAGAKKANQEVIKQKAHKEAKLVKDAETLQAVLNDITVNISVKANEEGRIFGSVTNMQISEAIENQYHYVVDRKMIVIADDHIKTLGLFDAKVKLHKGIDAVVKVNVVAE